MFRPCGADAAQKDREKEMKRTSEVSESQIASRMDAALRRSLSTPPKPHTKSKTQPPSKGRVHKAKSKA